MNTTTYKTLILIWQVVELILGLLFLYSSFEIARLFGIGRSHANYYIPYIAPVICIGGVLSIFIGNKKLGHYSQFFIGTSVVLMVYLGFSQVLGFVAKTEVVTGASFILACFACVFIGIHLAAAVVSKLVMRWQAYRK